MLINGIMYLTGFDHEFSQFVLFIILAISLMIGLIWLANRADDRDRDMGRQDTTSRVSEGWKQYSKNEWANSMAEAAQRDREGRDQEQYQRGFKAGREVTEQIANAETRRALKDPR